MKSVTQKARYRQAIIKYAEKYGVTKAANRYNVNRQYIYRWKNRYDGTLDSLADKSHRPHSHPNQHTEQELKLISDMRRRNPNAGLVVFWVKLRQRARRKSNTWNIIETLDIFLSTHQGSLDHSYFSYIVVLMMLYTCICHIDLIIFQCYNSVKGKWWKYECSCLLG